MTAQIHAEGVRKRYGDAYALDGFDLSVPAGTLCGLLGPNGAGKTTAVRVLSTLLRHDEGVARVAGFDVATEPAKVRSMIGLVGQQAAVDEILSGRQNLVLFGRLHHLGRREATRRADDLLERFGLAETGPKPVSAYSGGMRRRLDLAASLLAAPRVLFLDEPTTVLLTTQYLEEADQLADRISLVEHGRVIAEGTPAELKGSLGATRIDLVLTDPEVVGPATALLARVTGAEPVAEELRVSAPAEPSMLADVVRELAATELPFADVALRHPTLDEVFLELTGVAR
ncbi:ATP-binding cassette domain-containing protein [Amycolatopsis sp. SID8362]|uniref:ATP-binding cassette domain-containing protein n=1 Tax=Amycolatopsis sp. SID8362 TaxID=2690346 RepID=UPI00136F2D56|nr:ATP-binding cassette domain-containing protein [Amycolatopsis sp. SID8362]NBH04962.1 ATP-binding cassette domain-containing protein [Amycolatopsis sp. SID8362]NED41662.1 ATP-binding cassette domain-containing protein [Amycolatopsis sp. SID8362]